jgi:hypothetical protein
MSEAEALNELKASAQGWTNPALTVRRAHVIVDENRDGDPITRVLLLVTDPEKDTWDVAQVRELRQSLGRRATQLDLPPVSLTLVAESERDDAEVFTR